MICFDCGHCSQHVACPYCGKRTVTAGNVRMRVGLDIPNPFSIAYDLGGEVGRAVLGTNDAPGDRGESPSFGDTISGWVSQIPNPFGSAYDLGREVGDRGMATVKAPLDAVSSLLTVVKYVVVAGAVVAVVVVGYGVIKFIPVALGIAAKQAEMGVKTIGTVATKAL